MMLPKVRLVTRANWRGQYSGLDSPGVCQHPEHFQKYPYAVSYQYNSRGFRDQEWPDSLDQLRSAVWCVGDSFTVGLGQPYDHIWPQVLQHAISARTINVSLDGASNQWIARQARMIMQEIGPANVVIMWSYLSRREVDDDSLTDEERRLPYIKATEYEDAQVFDQCRRSISGYATNVVESIIPYPHAMDEKAFDIHQTWAHIKGQDWPAHPPKTRQELNALPKFIIDELREIHRCFATLRDWLPDAEASDVGHIVTELFDGVYRVPQLDHARDGHHFDIKTARQLVQAVAPMLVQ